MSNFQYSIPPEFQGQLRLRETVDRRTDEEILDSLTKYRPVTSEKNVWAFWHSGILTMPGWCRRNVIDWVRLLDSTWTVRLLDPLPDSPNYMLNYVPASSLNDALVSGTMDGQYVGPHSADLLRGACLVTHGGVFMDVGIILIRDLDSICWNRLEDPTSPYQISTPLMFGLTMANHFVAARKGDPFIERWHRLFVHLWENRTNHQGLVDDPRVSFMKEISLDRSRSHDFKWDFKVPASTVMEYITQVVCWMRMCMLEDPNDGFSGVEYWQKHVLLWNVLKENWAAEAAVGFGEGEKMYQLLSMRLDSDPDDPAYKEAYDLVWRLLTKSSMQKVTHAKGLTNSTHLGVLWDENPGKDCEPGTFADLLRYGTVHFQQTRPEIEYVTAPAPEPEEIMRKGLLEP